MKKLMIALAFVGLGTAAANAQTSIETPSKYVVATNPFWSNWYVQLGVDATVQDPYHQGKFFSKDWHNGRSYGVDLAVGKWFSPEIGTRLKVNWENGQFAHAFRNTNHINTPDFEKGGYGAVYFDTQFNLSNIFCGYNENRVWNLIAFPRMGLLRNFDECTYAPALGVGLESSWKVSKSVSVFVDGVYSWTTENFQKYIGQPTDAFSGHGIASVDLGVQINLGKSTWSKAVSIEAYNALAASSEEALAKLRADLDRERQINADLRAQLAAAGKRKPDTDAVIANAATSVFFNINSTKIESKKDLINLESVASVAKNTGAKVVVTGSADSQTGSSAWNQQLSEGRAQAVADELVNMGVSRDKITVNAIGGVNQVSPYTLNRRAVVELK